MPVGAAVVVDPRLQARMREQQHEDLGPANRAVATASAVTQDVEDLVRLRVQDGVAKRPKHVLRRRPKAGTSNEQQHATEYACADFCIH